MKIKQVFKNKVKNIFLGHIGYLSGNVVNDTCEESVRLSKKSYFFLIFSSIKAKEFDKTHKRM